MQFLPSILQNDNKFLDLQPVTFHALRKINGLKYSEENCDILIDLEIATNVISV